MRSFAQKQNQPQKPVSSSLPRPKMATPGPHHREHPRLEHDFSRLPLYPSAAGAIQTKIASSKPEDDYEQEADRISKQMIRMPEPQLQRACTCGGACPKCQTEQPERGDERAQTARVGSGDRGQTDVPPIVTEVLRSPGQPIDPATRAFMEPRFGHDFSRVRVHTDTAANASARAVNARAYTVGHDIVFGTGQFAPASAEGTKLIAHELAHVVQQREGATAMPESLKIAPRQDCYEQEADQTAKAVTRESAPAGRALISQWSGADEWSADLAPFMSRFKSGLSLQRQPCSKADDRIVTGPLTTQLPNIKCEPSPEKLETVRAVPKVPPTIMGVTESTTEGQEIEFRELKASKCKATVLKYATLNFGPFMYAKAGTYEIGTEVTPAHRACPEGKTIAKRLLITEEGAKTLRWGEIEHCEDQKLAFALSMGKYDQAIKDLEGEYCAADPSARPNEPICEKEFANRFENRTGIEFAKRQQISDCLGSKSALRDSPPRKWHDIVPDDLFYAKDCSLVTYIVNPGAAPHIGKHPSSEIVKGCGEKEEQSPKQPPDQPKQTPAQPEKKP